MLKMKTHINNIFVDPEREFRVYSDGEDRPIVVKPVRATLYFAGFDYELIDNLQRLIACSVCGQLVIEVELDANYTN